MSQPLKSGLKLIFDDKQLSEIQLEQLQNLISSQRVEGVENHGPAPVKKTLKSRVVRTFKTRHSLCQRHSIFTAIGTTCVALLLIFILLPHSATLQDVATEVANNHRHLKPLTIQSNSYQQVQSFFTDLNFDIEASSLLDAQRWQLLGGRYCSLNGIKAAQLRLRDKRNNSIQTFYQVENKAVYFENIPNIGENELPLRVNIDGVPVDVWSEGGIIYSLTHAPTL